MIIVRIDIFNTAVPLSHKIEFSKGRSVEELRSIVVRIETDAGSIGWGEICPAGRTYGSAFAEGALAALQVIAPVLVGLRSDEPGVIQSAMDSAIAGHAYAKGPVYQACLDCVTKHAGLPAYTFLGGLVSKTVTYPGFIMTGSPEKTKSRMAALRLNNTKHFIPHGSGDVSLDIENAQIVHDALQDDETMSVDANGGYSRMAALRFIAGLPKSSRIVIEQPCSSYEDCAAVKRATGVPMVLDECMTGFEPMVRAWADSVIDGLKLKIDRVGGIWKAKQMRDAAAELGLPLWIQVSAGTEISEAAMIHLAVATPRHVFMGAGALTELNSNAIGTTAIERIGGGYVVGDKPGFGVCPDPAVIGDPVASFS